MMTIGHSCNPTKEEGENVMMTIVTHPPTHPPARTLLRQPSGGGETVVAGRDPQQRRGARTWACAVPSHTQCRYPVPVRGDRQWSTGEVQVARCKWRGTSGEVQVARYKWRGTSGEVQVARCKWRGTSGEVQVARCKWRGASGGTRAAGCGTSVGELTADSRTNSGRSSQPSSRPSRSTPRPWEDAQSFEIEAKRKRTGPTCRDSWENAGLLSHLLSAARPAADQPPLRPEDLLHVPPPRAQCEATTRGDWHHSVG